MKWTCHKCGCLNPGLAWRCHSCKTWCLEDQHTITTNNAVIELPKGVEIDMTKLTPIPKIDMSYSTGVSSEDKFPTLNDVEKEHIIKAMIRFDKNKTKVAKVLGISLKGFYNRLKAHGLEDQYRVNR